jgi:hypothetical protein
MIAVAILPACGAVATWVPSIRAIEPLAYVVNLPAAVTHVGAASYVPARGESGHGPTLRIVLSAAWLAGFLRNLALICGVWWRVRQLRKIVQKVRLAGAPNVRSACGSDNDDHCEFLIGRLDRRPSKRWTIQSTLQ